MILAPACGAFCNLYLRSSQVCDHSSNIIFRPSKHTHMSQSATVAPSPTYRTHLLSVALIALLLVLYSTNIR